jgi:hypothetical protein
LLQLLLERVAGFFVLAAFADYLGVFSPEGFKLDGKIL